MPKGDLDARRTLTVQFHRPLLGGIHAPSFGRDTFAGGVTGLEESLWPFALQQKSLSDAPAGRRVCWNEACCDE
jgi:hypothetical protein